MFSPQGLKNLKTENNVARYKTIDCISYRASRSMLLTSSNPLTPKKPIILKIGNKIWEFGNIFCKDINLKPFIEST